MAQEPKTFCKTSTFAVLRGSVYHMLHTGDVVDGLGLVLHSQAGLALITVSVVVASLALLRVAFGFARFIYTNFLRPGISLRRQGSWAIVTGATDGIGKAYCEALAERGMNLVLVSRTESKLEACERELRSRHGIQTKRLAADLCQANDDTYTQLAGCLVGLDVGVLVNNAGMGYEPCPEYLEAVSDEMVKDMIALNMLAPTRLAKLVLPGMKARGRGVIVNVGSGASTALPSAPLTTVYAASKAYIEALSQSLDAECREFGVRVQNQAPMYVATKMSKVASPTLDKPSPATWARAAVAQIGRETSASPYWFHGLQIAMLRRLPQSLVAAAVRSTLFKMREDHKKTS